MEEGMTSDECVYRMCDTVVDVLGVLMDVLMGVALV